VERNSSALLGKNEKARTKMMLKMKHTLQGVLSMLLDNG
jgi:hypothetical protein